VKVGIRTELDDLNGTALNNAPYQNHYGNSPAHTQSVYGCLFYNLTICVFNASVKQYLPPAVHFLIKELFRQNAVVCHFESEDGTAGNEKQ
jgi:hypothetical protein